MTYFRILCWGWSREWWWSVRGRGGRVGGGGVGEWGSTEVW